MFKRKLAVCLIFLAAIFLFQACCYSSTVRPAYAESQGKSVKKPQWRVLWLVMPEVKTTLKNGKKFAMNMTDKDIKKTVEISGRFKKFIESATNGYVDIALDVYIAQKPVTTLSLFDKTEDGKDSYWVSLEDLPQDAKQKASAYDTVMATVRLAGKENTVADSWWGLGLCGYCLVQMLEGYDLNYLDVTADNPYPEELYVHEWTHNLEHFYEDLGYKFPGADDAEVYGYKSKSNIGINGFHHYYIDIYNAKVYDPDSKKYIGVTKDMWYKHPRGTY